MLFNKAAIEALRVLPFSPGEDCVVVANDWHTAMLPAIIKVNALAACLQIKQQSFPPTALYLDLTMLL